MRGKLLVTAGAVVFVAARLVAWQRRDYRWQQRNVVHLFADPPDYGTDDDTGGEDGDSNYSHGYVPGFPAH